LGVEGVPGGAGARETSRGALSQNLGIPGSMGGEMGTE
jgi:hypothetical protein